MYKFLKRWWNYGRTNRWWIYFQERFPPLKNGLLIAIFAASAVGYSALLSMAAGSTRTDLIPLPGFILIAFISLFISFFQLRVSDEFKDYADDMKYRPYRPVPRGVVSLDDLGFVAIATAAVQVGLAVPLDLRLVPLLGLLWFYMVLMRQEFFIPHWLKAHPWFYLISHMVIMPLLAFYASACYWLPAQVFPGKGLGWFLVVSFFNGMVIELGRKIRAPEQEETGVETYTALWGRPRAVASWLAAVAGMAIATLFAARPIAALPLVAIVLLVLLTAAMVVAWRFLSHPVAAWARGFELLSGLGTLLVYASLGLLPFILPSATP